jgi:hypothetical protein
LQIALRPLLIAILGLAWLLPGLIGHDPWKPDEAYTFGVVYEILQGGSWVIPQIAGEPFIDKPPLFHLISAASALLFSPFLALHDGARLAAGLWIGIALLSIAFASRELHGPRHGLVAALLLLGSLGLVVRGHQLITDVAALAGFAMAYYGAALSPCRTRRILDRLRRRHCVHDTGHSRGRDSRRNRDSSAAGRSALAHTALRGRTDGGRCCSTAVAGHLACPALPARPGAV